MYINAKAIQYAGICKLCFYLESAQTSLDVCLYILSNRDLADSMIIAQKNGAKVRLLIDHTMAQSEPYRLQELVNRGVIVQPAQTRFMLHHKFAVVDNKLVITGSFNWTAQATLGNFDNAVISSNSALVTPYTAEFQRLWNLFSLPKDSDNEKELKERLQKYPFLRQAAWDDIIVGHKAPDFKMLNKLRTLFVRYFYGDPSPSPATEEDDANNTANAINEVLFFPDEGIVCNGFLLNDNAECKFGPKCKYLHRPTSLSKMGGYLESAETSIDICMYIFTSRKLTEAILRVIKERQCRVRILIEASMILKEPDRAKELYNEGVILHATKISIKDLGFMHHKFAIVDNKLVMAGSFNWTRQASMGNYDNVIVSNSAQLVTPFVKEFDRLWTTLSEPFVFKQN
ncbi:hypothetical protein B566_EDAN015754 [Ephemera danica]|nr:hypothetical protein B566_EDAN015754 [Ephemera danica]